MFILIRIIEKVELPPRFLKDGFKKGVRKLLNSKYTGNVLLDIGFCICVYDILRFEKAEVREGNIIQNVEFRVIVFKPQLNETMIGTIVSQDLDSGLTISVGFFKNIYIPPQMLPSNARYNQQEKCFEIVNGPNNVINFQQNQKVVFKVVNVYFNHNFGNVPKRENEELVEYQLLNPKERPRHTMDIKKRRLERIKEEMSKNQNPIMYIVGTQPQMV